MNRLIGNPDEPLPDVDSRIAPLVRIAAELRNLATDEFQARLKQELVRSVSVPDYGGTDRLNRADGVANVTVETDEPIVGQGSQATGLDLEPRDVASALDSLDETAARSPARSVRVLASLDRWRVGVARYSDQTPFWNRNPDADELLHVLEGELDVTSLSEAGPIHTSVPAGSVFVCQRGLWHWQRPNDTASLLLLRPEKGTEYSQAALPKQTAQKRVGFAESEAEAPQMTARNVRAALSGIPVLAISDKTTGEEAASAFPQLGSLNGCGLYAGRFSGLSPWERHTSADELLHVLEGELEITTLTDQGPVRNTLRAGTIFVCPRGLWHRQYSAHGVLEFSATPQPTEVSFAEDPRA